MKTTRAFRTIGEAADELGLQAHVLRFWESKFSQIQPLKRGGGRRFYRPEDIEFIRGIKTLLHDERHPIKDVQKLIKRNGAASVVELGRSVERASREREVRDTVLVPQRILNSPKDGEIVPQVVAASIPAEQLHSVAPTAPIPVVKSSLVQGVSFEPTIDEGALRDALARLRVLDGRWNGWLEAAA